MRFPVVISAILILASPGAAEAQAEKDAVPLGTAAKIAKMRFEEASAKAEKEYQGQRADARQQYLADLEAALKAAIAAGDLDEALKIRELKNSLETGGDSAKPYLADLEAALKVATAAGDLDEALKIRELKNSLETDGDSIKPSVLSRDGAVTWNGRQFKIILGEFGWLDVRGLCQQVGRDLASIDSKEKRTFLAKHVGKHQLWVGASFNIKSQRWRWVNGKPVAADAWSPGRPQNNGPCAVIFGSSMLLGDGKDVLPDCDGFICEWKP